MYRSIESNTTNLFGQHWTAIKHKLFVVEDIRPRYGEFTAPWEYYNGYDKFIATPKLVAGKYSHDDLCNQRATEIFNTAKSQNKKIAILWSGGIDSTMVLSSFIKNVTTADLDNFVILLNLDSIVENPEFYRKFISEKIACMSTADLKVGNNFLNNNILLTGEPADGIYGPSTRMYRDLIATGQHKLSWKNNLQLLIDSINKFSPACSQEIQNTIPKQFANWYVDKVSRNLISAGVDGVDTVSDWWWWHYFSLKWDHLIWRPIYQHKGRMNESISTENLQQFLTNTYFNTNEFQLWSYNNLPYLTPKDLRQHKLDAKRYIFELDHNQDYFENKLKMPSISINDHFRLQRSSICFDKNWVGHHAQEPGVADFLKMKLDNYTG